MALTAIGSVPPMAAYSNDHAVRSTFLDLSMMIANSPQSYRFSVCLPVLTFALLSQYLKMSLNCHSHRMALILDLFFAPIDSIDIDFDNAKIALRLG